MEHIFQVFFFQNFILCLLQTFVLMQFASAWLCDIGCKLKTITMHLQLEKISQCQSIWSDPEVSFVFEFLFCWWAVICNIPRAFLILNWRSSFWYDADVALSISMCIVCGFESRCLSTISSNIPFDLKAIIFQKNFDFSDAYNLPLLWTWRISPWFLDISRYQCWQPTYKTSGLVSKVLRIFVLILRTQQWIRKWHSSLICLIICSPFCLLFTFSVFQPKPKQNSFFEESRYCFRQKIQRCILGILDLLPPHSTWPEKWFVRPSRIVLLEEVWWFCCVP